MILIIEDNITSFKKKIDTYQEEFMSELKMSIGTEGEKAVDEIKTMHDEEIAKLKEMYLSSEKFYTDRHQKNQEEFSKLFEEAYKEYNEKIEALHAELDDTKLNITSSVEDVVTDLKQALSIKDEFITSAEANKEKLKEVEEQMNSLQNEFAPSIDKLKALIEEKALELQEKINVYSKDIESQGEKFNIRLEELSSDAKITIEAKISEFDSVIEEVSNKMDSLLEEKNSEFDALKAHYEGLSESLTALQESIAEAVNIRIAEANNIIEENVNAIEENANEKYEKYIARLNSNLEQTLSLLMNDAKAHIQTAKEEIIKSHTDNLDEYDKRITNMKDIVSALEEDITKYSSEIEARLESINLSYDEKTNIILKDLDNQTEDLKVKLADAVASIDNMLEAKTNDISLEYDAMKVKIDGIGQDIAKYMNTVKVFDNAKEMAESIKGDVAKLNELVKDTKVTTTEMNKTMSEFENLKKMHHEILDYASSIKKEKDSLKDTQEKVNMLMDMSGEIQERFVHIAENNAMIEHTEEGIQLVIDIASQIENKLSFIKDKEEYADDILQQVRKAEIETEVILERVDSIKAAMVDVEDTRKNFMDKIYSLERDFAKIEKNDKKVQLFISKLEEIDDIIQAIQDQRENLVRLKGQYEDYDKTIVKNLERAEYFVRYLETLLDNADKYMPDKPGKGSKREKADKVDSKREELIIKMYKQGWKPDDIVKNTSYSRDEVEKTIKSWKDKQSRG